LVARSLGFWISDVAARCSPARADGDVAVDAFAEPMRRLGLGGDGEAGDAKLPERPGEADCAYYLRTGACGYGERCRYNHPRDRDRATPVSAASSRAVSPLPTLFCSVLFCFFGSCSACDGYLSVES